MLREPAETADTPPSWSSRVYLCERDLYGEFLEWLLRLCHSELGYLRLFHGGHNAQGLNIWSENALRKYRAGPKGDKALAQAGILADCIQEGGPVYQSPPEGNYLSIAGMEFNNHMSIPVFQSGQVVAIIGIGNSPQAYNQHLAEALSREVLSSWPQMMERLGEIELSHTQQPLNNQQFTSYDYLNDIFRAISGVIEARDNYTSHHQQNVASTATLIGERLGFNRHQLFGLNIMGLLHDIGKIAIPSDILVKPAKLSTAEYALIRTHAKKGAEFFANLRTPWPLAEAIHQHHERLDGSGYPRGLKKLDILMEARILGVADTFDAIIMPRPYRQAGGIQKAIEVIKAGRGSKYDAYVVDTLLDTLDEDTTLGGIYPSP